MFNKNCSWLDSNRGPPVLEATLLPTVPRPVVVGCVAQFRYQRFAVRIQSSTKNYLYLTFVYCQLCIKKTKIKKKSLGMAHFKKNSALSGCGWLCGSVGRVVTSNARGPRFESSGRQKFIYIEKTKIKKKSLGMAHF